MYRELLIPAGIEDDHLYRTLYYVNRTVHPKPESTSRYPFYISSTLTVPAEVEQNGTEVYCRDGIKRYTENMYMQRATATVLGKIFSILTAVDTLSIFS